MNFPYEEFLHILELLVPIILMVYLFSIYNGLVALKNAIFRDRSNIEVILKQRNSELTKLIDSCTQYMQYEVNTLDNLTKLREQIHAATEHHDISKLGTLETDLRKNLGALFARAENYPDLKANNSFIQLQNRMSELEDTISDRRELYNSQVTNNNTRIALFPDVVVARLFGFGAFELLHFSAEETADINTKSQFNS